MVNSRQLAMRDPALAALVGALSGSDFGAEATSFGSDFGDEYGADFGDELGAEFGDEYGDDAGADFGASAPHPTPQQALALWKRHHHHRSHTHRRELKLYPNKGSSLQLEQFSFPLNPATNPVIGTATSPLNMTNQPDVTIRPERISFNVPSAGLYIVSEVKVANVGAIVGGSASQDAFFFNPQSVGMRLSCPTLSPANRLTIVGAWLALVPPGFVNGIAFPLSAVATGPAKMAG